MAVLPLLLLLAVCLYIAFRCVLQNTRHMAHAAAVLGHWRTEHRKGQIWLFPGYATTPETFRPLLTVLDMDDVLHSRTLAIGYSMGCYVLMEEAPFLEAYGKVDAYILLAKRYEVLGTRY